MSAIRFARLPLLLAIMAGLVGAAVLLLPRFGVDLGLGDSAQMIGLGLGALTLVLLLVSLVMGGRASAPQVADDDEDGLVSVPAFEVDDEPVVTAKMSKADKKAVKDAAKAEAKAAKEREKFEKQAQKDAAKAAKKSGKKGAAEEQATEDWLNDLRAENDIVDETDSFSAPAPMPVPVAIPLPQVQEFPMPEPVVYDEPAADFDAPAWDATQPVDYQALSSPTDLPMYDMAPVAPVVAEVAFEQTEYAVAEEVVEVVEVDMVDTVEAAEPDWASGIYDDPTFLVPFGDEVAEAHADGDSEVVEGEDPMVEEYSEYVEEIVVDEAQIDLVDPYAEPVEEFVAEHEDETLPAEVDAVFPEADEAEQVEEIDPDSPEGRLAALAASMMALIGDAQNEVRKMRHDVEAERVGYEEKVADLSGSLAGARAEMSMMAEELAVASDAQAAALDAKAALAQAELSAARADLERQQTLARLRQVRIAIMSKDPVDRDLLAVVEKAMADHGHTEEPDVEPSHEEHHHDGGEHHEEHGSY